MYAGYKIDVLMGRKDVDILQAVQEDHLDDSYIFTAEQGFNVAVSLVSHLGIIDPSYARLRFMKYEFFLSEDGEPTFAWYELESHQCTQEELGLSGTDHKFWPPKKSQENILQNFGSSFLCLNQSDLRIQGSWASENT